MSGSSGEPLSAQIHEQAIRATVPPPTARRRSTVFLGAAILAFSAFFSLLMVVRANPRMERDVVATIRVQTLRHPLMTLLMRIVSWFGFRPQSLVLPTTAVAGIWLIGFRREARYLCFAWLGSLVSYTTKRFVRRPRPSGEGIIVQLANLRDSSFPSGHTLHYTAFWGFFAYLCFSEIQGRWLRWLPVTGISSVIGLVGPSRIYLGHHWLTDVLASYCLGVGYLASLIGLHRRHIGDQTPWRRDAAEDQAKRF
ncbi:MAG: phosphatase PAP2 family protein [Vicinamibacterales bacterium]